MSFIQIKDTMQSPELLPDKYARIDNQFVFNARYRLPAREQKIILYLISKINPIKENEFHKQRLSIGEMKQLLTREGAKYGSFYSELTTIAETMTNCKITFPTQFEFNGTRLKGAINWFQHCIPIEDEKGELYLEFVFSEILKPFIIDLKEYVKIGVAEVFPMRSGYAIRMFQLLKAEYDRLKEYKRIVHYDVSLDKLKELLSIEGKYNYPDFKNFRVRVLDPIRDDINEFSNNIQVDYDYLKTGKKVTGIKFIISAKNDKDKPLKITPSVSDTEKPEKSTKSRKGAAEKQVDISNLTRAQLQGLKLLSDFGVFEGIAVKQILPSIGGSELVGFEDIFIQKALVYFQKNAKKQGTTELNASTFVVWWHDKKIFDSQSDSGAWGILMEQVSDEKKKMQKNEPQAYDNRLVARTMTNEAFEQWYRDNK
jgi:plasmid replication initiation protein